LGFVLEGALTAVFRLAGGVEGFIFAGCQAPRKVKKRGRCSRAFHAFESKDARLLFQVRIRKCHLCGRGCEIFFREFKRIGSGCRFLQLSLDLALSLFLLLFLP
jgi:hypothetical protein